MQPRQPRGLRKLQWVMLGLGNSITTSGGSFDAPPPSISDLTLYLAALDSTAADSGTDNPSGAANTLFDIRIYIQDAPSYTGNASDYTVTSLTARNVTTGSIATELLSSDLTMDSVIDLAGFGIIFWLFDNDSPMDDIDFGSLSGSPHAHNGSQSSNNYEFTATITVNGYEGEATVTYSVPLNDSDV